DAVRQTPEGVVIFDIEGKDIMVNRYAPFYFFPEARYSAGIVRRDDGGAKLTAMRNPWIEFPSAPLGELCARLGGGGHQRVGSVLVQQEDPRDVLGRLIDSLTAWERACRD